MEILKVGNKIKVKRTERDLTQEKLANMLGVTKAAVSKWETGEGYPDITMLPRIAGLFHITIDELLGYNPKNEPPIIVSKCTAGFSLDDLEDDSILDHGTIESCTLQKGYSGYHYNVIGEEIPEDRWMVRVLMTSTEDDFPYIMQKCIKPGRLVDMYSYRYVDDKIIDDDKPNKHYVCREKVWEYKIPGSEYVRKMLAEQLKMGFIDEEELD